MFIKVKVTYVSLTLHTPLMNINLIFFNENFIIKIVATIYEIIN